MNLFAQSLKFEDGSDVGFPEGVLITEGDEGESVAAAIAEATQEEAGVEEESRVMDQFINDGDDMGEVVEAVEEAPKTEHAGLTPVNARLLAKVMNHIAGKSYTASKMPKMEHFDSRANAREGTQFVMEGVKDSLRGFWQALKAQFQKLWAKVKTWYIKTFSSAKKIAERAKTIRDRAEGAAGTIDKKSFQFGQVKILAINGKLKTASEFETALNVVAKIVEEVNDTPTDSQLDKLADALDGYKPGKVGHSTAIEAIATTYNGFNSVLDGTNVGKLDDSKVIDSLGGGDKGDAEIVASVVLPGDKHLVRLTARSKDDINKVLRMTRITFVNTKDKPKEVSGDAEAVTLNNAQIAKLCDTINSSAGDIVDFESKWQKVDKAQETVLRKIDELMRDGVQETKDDENATSGDERELRTIASNATQFVRRSGSLQSVINDYALNVYAATLNWCEGSMRNFKK